MLFKSLQLAYSPVLMSYSKEFKYSTLISYCGWIQMEHLSGGDMDFKTANLKIIGIKSGE